MPSFARPSPPARRAGGRGFTLLELLAVMSILAVLMGIGIGVFSRVNVSKFTAVGTVRNVLRVARENAIASSLPVSVVCDGPNERVFDLSVRPFGHWQFEDEAAAGGSGSVGSPAGGTGAGGSGAGGTGGGANEAASTGAFGLNARLFGARIGMPGRTGAALVCAKAGDHAVVPLGERGEWGFRDGVSAELDVEVGKLADNTLLRRGRQFLLRVLADGTVEAEVGLAEAEEKPKKTGGQLVATSKAGLVIPGKWIRLGFVYDRQALTLTADGVPIETRDANLPVIDDTTNLEIGDKSQAFVGKLDSVKLGSISTGDAQKLPRYVTFATATKRQVVHFAPDGRLDTGWHRAEAVIVLLFPENVRREIRVGPYGVVR